MMAATKSWSRQMSTNPCPTTTLARYEDELVKRGGEWLIAKRRRVE